jgi:N-acetyl sugar amidotransferase
MVEYCSSCVISNQRPNSTIEFFNEIGVEKETIKFSGGICDACRVASRKQEIDWQSREEELWALCDRFRSSDGSYDCVVPGSGGKDSFYASHILKNKYKMHPITVTWAPHLYTDWGRKNHDSWINAGHDNLLMTPNGRVHRLLTRLATENLLHPFQPFMLGQKLLAPRLAQQLGIELVFFGENEAEYGNPVSDQESPLRSPSYYSEGAGRELRIGGVPISSLVEDYGLELADLNAYLPLAAGDSSPNTQVHYLGYYLKWHPQSAYYYAVEHGGFIPSPERTPGTYSKYNSIDDKIDDLHYYTTGVKFGIGRATYDAAQEIRSGDITREEGVALVNRFDHEFPSRFMPELMAYLSIPEKEFPTASKAFEKPIIDEEYFKKLCDSFRSPHLWQYDGSWQLRHPIS